MSPVNLIKLKPEKSSLIHWFFENLILHRWQKFKNNPIRMKKKSLFKYTTKDGAKNILNNRKILFSAPKILNDPFEAHMSEKTLFRDDIFEERRLRYMLKKNF